MERRRGGRCDDVEDPQQRVARAPAVTADRRRIVEVVARVHPHTFGEAGAHRDLALLVEERDLHAVDPGGVLVHDGQQRLRRAVEVARTPVSGQRGIEHVAQPVDDDRRADLREDPRVDLLVVLGATGAGRECARGHQDDASAHALDEPALLLVGRLDVRQRHARPRLELIGARARGEDRAAHSARLGDAAPDQLARRRPVEAHAALGRVHRLGHGEAQRPDVVPIAERRVPVERDLERGVDRGEWVGDDVDGRHPDAAGDRPRRRRDRGPPGERVRRERSVGAWQPERGRHGAILPCHVLS